MATHRPDLVALDQAYRATAYCVIVREDELCLRIGAPSERLDRLLREHNAQTWAIITAENPRSMCKTAEQNRAARTRLADVVARVGYQALPVVARADAGDWPAEHGLLILAITRESSLALARQFSQVALVFGKEGKPPELVFCNP